MISIYIYILPDKFDTIHTRSESEKENNYLCRIRNYPIVFDPFTSLRDSDNWKSLTSHVSMWRKETKE